MADKSIKLMFSVLGGDSVSVDSGKKIKEEIDSIIAQINPEIKVTLNKTSLKTIKNTVNNEISNLTLTPGKASLQRMRSEIQNHLQAIPVAMTTNKGALQTLRSEVQNYFKDNPIPVKWTIEQNATAVPSTTATTPGTPAATAGKTVADSKKDIAAARSELDRLIRQYEAAQKKFETSAFKSNVGEEQRAVWQQQASEYERLYTAALEKVKQHGEDAWQSLAASAEQKMQTAVERIKSETESARAKLLDSASKNTTAAKDKLDEFEAENGKVEQLTQAYEKLEQAQIALYTNTSRESMTGFYEALQNFNKELKDAPNNIDASRDGIAALKSEIVDLEKNGKLTDDQMERLQEITEKLGGNVSVGQLKALKKEVDDIGKASEDASSKASKFGDAIKKALSRFTGEALITRAIMSAIRSMRQMISATIELDDALTQMRIVTRGSESDMESFAVSVAQTAKSIGSDMTGLIESATVFARLGYSEAESSMLAKYTAMLSNVGDIDISQAQNNVTAIVKAFNLGVGDIETVMDKLVAVGNNFPISVSQITEGMANAASALKISGNSLEESIALLTAANAATQNISKASTGLRTIAARISRVTTELDDLGEVMTDSKYNDLLDALTKNTGGRVKIIDSVTGDLRSTYDILKDLAAVWDELGAKEQSAISEALSGTRQKNILASVLNNFREAEKAMTAMDNSFGTLSNSYDTYLESITAHINTFKASFQELSYTLFSTDMIKDVVDAGTSLMGVLQNIAIVVNQIVSALGGLSGILYIVTAGAFLKNLNNIAKVLKTIFTLNIGSAINSASSSLLLYATRLGKTLGTTTAFAGAIMGVATAAAVAGFALLRLHQRNKEAQEQARKNNEKNAEEALKTSQSLGDVIARYKEVGKESATAEGHNERIADIQSEINNLLGQQASQIDIINGKYDEQIGKLNDIYDTQLEDTRQKLNTLLNQHLYDYEHVVTEMGSADISGISRLVGLLRQVEGMDTRAFFGGIQPGAFIGNEHTAKEWESYLQELYDFMTAEGNSWWRDIVSGSFLGTSASQLQASVESELERVKGITRDYVADIQNYADTLAAKETIKLDFDVDTTTIKEFEVKRKEIIDSITGNEEISGAISAGFIDTSAVEASVDELLMSKFPDMFKQFEMTAIASVENAINSLADIMKRSGVDDEIDDVKSRIESLKKYIDSMDAGEFNLASIKQLKADFPDLSEAIDAANGDIEKLRYLLSDAIVDAPQGLISNLKTLRDSGAIPDDLIGSYDALVAELEKMAAIPTESVGAKFKKMVSDVSDASSTLTSTLGNVAGITIDDYQKLIETNSAFADAIEFTGNAISINAEKAGQIVSDMVDDYVKAIDEQIDADMRRIQVLQRKGNTISAAEAKEMAQLRLNVQEYRIMRSELQQLTSSYQKWVNSQSTPNDDTMFSELKKAADYVNDVLTNKGSEDYLQWNTDDFKAALEYLHGDIQSFMDDAGALDTAKVIQYLKEIKRYTGDEFSSFNNFITALVKSGLGDITDGVFKLFEETPDGLKMTVEYIAEKLNMSKDAVTTLFKLAETYGMHFDFTDEEDLDQVSKLEEHYRNILKLKNEINGETGTGGEQPEDGRDPDDIDDLTKHEEAFNSVLEDRNNTANQYLDIMQKVKELQTWLDEHKGEGTGGESGEEYQHNQEALEAYMQQIDELLSTVDADKLTIDVTLEKEALEGEISVLEQRLQELKLAGLDTTEVEGKISDLQTKLEDLQPLLDGTYNLDDKDATESLEQVQKLLDGIDSTLAKSRSLDIATSSAQKSLQIVSTWLSGILTKIQKIAKTNVTLRLTGQDNSGGSGEVSGSGVAMSRGTYRPFKGGNALVGELGQEMYVDPETNTWYTVGDTGPEFVKLPKGAIVFNHQQTRALLGKGRTAKRGTAMVSGGGKLPTAPTTTVSIGQQKQTDPKSKKKKKTFQEEYEYHKHLVAMDKETEAEYLAWLEKAYKKAYKKKQITLEEYYRYQEEVYQGLKDQFMDYINDMDAYLDNLMHYDGTTRKVYESYRAALKKIQSEINAAKKRGLTDNDEYVQQLKQQYWQYYDAMTQLSEDVDEKAKDSVDDLVRYRIDMIKHELNKEKESYQTRLNSLKDFYSKQKEMLRDAVEEEDYLSEQSKKRKAVSDIEMQLEQLALDTSAKAEKRKAELRESLAEAREELRIFERDHALEVAESQLDDLYERQEKSINAQIDRIDEHLEDQARLYDEAMEDIRSGGQDLYNEMLEYNRKYVDGTTDSIVKMWEEAYNALRDYKDLYGQWYEELRIGNYTGYQDVKPGSGSSMVESLPGDPKETATTTTTTTFKEPKITSVLQALKSKSGTQGAVLVSNSNALADSMANSLMTSISSALRSSGLVSNAVSNPALAAASGISFGDIVINGNATEQTVSEIRRIQRESIDTLLRELKKLNK